MAIISLARLTSGTQTQVDAESRSLAIQRALGNQPAQNSVLIGNVPRIWPELQKYVNDNSGTSLDFPSVPPPQFIWDSTTFTGGEVRYFAQAFNIESTQEHIIYVAVFADNAHRLFIEERAPSGTLVQSFTPEGFGLQDGLMVPTASQTDDVTTPFNWQKIRLWSSDDIEPTSTDNFIVFSFEVMNYNTTDTVNPAGLAYFIDIYRESN